VVCDHRLLSIKPCGLKKYSNSKVTFEAKQREDYLTVVTC